ncbi:MAG: hypothetical protein IPL99_13425 [Candidatus Competibacteraceae bacterium]|nr:hypothetical protein [Candidatus Competibacteraceae bacterium]
MGLVEGHSLPWSERAQSSLINMGVQPSDGAVQNWIIKAGQLLADDHAANRQSIGTLRWRTSTKAGCESAAS